MSNNSANTLVAITAIFVTLVGTFSWTILAFIIHGLLVTRAPRDGVHYQLLAMLRNRYSPDIFAGMLLSIGWAWRKRPVRWLWLRTVGLATVGLVVWGLFIVAGVILSTIATTGDVLLVPANCGSFNYALVANQSTQVSDKFDFALSEFSAEDYGQAYLYAQVCYPGDDYDATQQQEREAPASNCNFYVQDMLNWTTSYPTECPFVEKSLCSGSVVQFDTGYLDTNDDLGKNTAPEDRLAFRRVTTCAPLSTEGFSSNGFINDSLNGDVAVYNYGVNMVQPPQIQAPNATFYYSAASYEANNTPYQIQFASTDIFGDEGEPAFVPDPRVAGNNTSVTLLFLANRAIYLDSVTDPWFQATEVIQRNSTLSAYTGDPNQTYYYNPAPGSVLGCVNEYHLCNPNLPSSSQCIPWPEAAAYTFGEATNSITPLQLNVHQTTLAAAVATLLYNSNYWSILNSLSSSALIAPNYLYTFGSLLSLPLPSTQWLAELQRLQATSMSILQRDSFTNVAGPTDPLLAAWMTINNTAWECTIQKYRSTAYTSFSVLGLGLIFGLGGLILLGGVAIRLVVPAVQKRAGSAKVAYCREQWQASGLLYLQRLVFEDRGIGAWEGELGQVPTTCGAERFESYTGAENGEQAGAVPVAERSDDGGDADGNAVGQKDAFVSEAEARGAGLSLMSYGSSISLSI